ncbi:MAG: hypothetical protein DYH05_11235 [Acidobacteria bacterium ACB1]|nr:hypothetical protein [Acidobacteria bacterium ACB1]RIJ94319.1 MAG: hypothetical protein DCC44_04795 [Acidobacteriota bacterium]
MSFRTLHVDSNAKNAKPFRKAPKDATAKPFHFANLRGLPFANFAFPADLRRNVLSFHFPHWY